MTQVAAGYKTLQRNFSVPPEQTFCTPTNFLPADAADLAEDGKGGPQTPFPAYENGACFMVRRAICVIFLLPACQYHQTTVGARATDVGCAP